MLLVPVWQRQSAPALAGPGREGALSGQHPGLDPKKAPLAEHLLRPQADKLLALPEAACAGHPPGAPGFTPQGGRTQQRLESQSCV